MSTKTKAKRAEKEKKRLESIYESPVKYKPREAAWKLYKTENIQYK